MTAATITPQRAVFADQDKRQITGRCVEYGVKGHGSITATFGAQALVLPQEIKRVKLFRDHRNPNGLGTPVGWMTHVENREDGLYATFQIGVGPDGDQALHDAQGVRDGLSIEVSNLQFSRDRRTVIRAELDAVALVPIPAYSEARVQSFHEIPDHTPNPDQEDTMPEQQQTVDTDVPDPKDNFTPPPAPDESAGVPKSQPTHAEPGPVAQFAGTASAPVALTAIRDRGPSFAEVASGLQAMMRGEASTAAFALADITANAFADDVTMPGWLGELWDGAEYERIIVPLLSKGELTKRRMVGWRWTTKPEVGPWQGNKTEVPTNTPATEPAEVVAQYLAAGWDIDRSFIDFNDQEFLRSFMQAAAEDYRIKTDAIAATFVNTSAPTVGSAPDLLKAVGVGRRAVKRRAKLQPTFVLVNDQDYDTLLDIGQFDAPAFLDLFGIQPGNFVDTDLIPQGSVIVGAKPAVAFYELPGSPIRARALDIARGGIDEAMYGYHAELLRSANGLAKVTIGATPAP